MPLEKQVVGVNFTKGLDTRDDPRLLLPGYMVTLDNATTSKTGTIVRRDGNTTLAALSGGAGVATFNNQLLSQAGNALSAYASATGTLASKGTVSNFTLAKTEILRSGGLQDQHDCAYAGGLTCYVWRNGDATGLTLGVNVLVKDEATGATVMGSTAMRTANGAGSPRVVAITGAFVIFYMDSGTTNLYGRVIQTGAPTVLGAEATLRTDVDASVSRVDACSNNAGVSVALIYATTNATNSVFAVRVDVSGTTPSVGAGPTAVITQAQVGSGTVGGLAIAAFSSTVLHAFALAETTAATPGLWGGALTNAMTVSVAAALKDATAAPLAGGAHVTAALNGSTMHVFSDDYARRGEATASVRLLRHTQFNAALGITSGPSTLTQQMTRPSGSNGPFIAGKAFTVGGNTYLPCCTIGILGGAFDLQQLWCLLTSSGVVVGKALYASLGLQSTKGVPSTPAPTATQVIVPAGEKTLLSFSSGTNVSQTGIAKLLLTFPTNSPALKATVGQNAFLSGAMLGAYDGEAATEAAFLLYPDGVACVPGSNIGGVVTVGDHLIVALYEHIDGSGQRHQSAPSIAIKYTAADSTHHATVTIPTLVLTARAGASLVVYATTAGGAIFYRLNAANAPIANTSASSTVTYDFNVADANITAGEVLYTTGGILPNNAPPPCSVCWTHQNRLWTDVGDDPGAFRFSQPAVSGFGLQFNETLGGRIPETIAGGVSMDDKSIIFSARSIYVVFGSGPGTTGANNGYSAPQQLATDVGCAEPRSVLLLPTGVLFKSLKGWYLLGRDLQVRYVGIGAEAYNGQGVTSAVLLADRQEARFTTNDANGEMLVFSYVSEDWSTFSSQVSADAVWWTGGAAYVRMTSAGLVQDLPPTTAAHALGAGFTYGDGATTITGGAGTPYPQTGSAIPLTFRTGWLKPGDALEAFQRIWWVVLTGLANGKAGGRTALSTFANALDLQLLVDSTASFPASGLANTLFAGFGAPFYGALAGTWSVTSATTIALGTPLGGDLDPGTIISTATATTAITSGSLTINFYVDGDDTTSVQTISIADVSGLTSGDVWHLRVQPVIQKCSAMQLQVVSTPAATDPGASLNFSGMTLEVGAKKGARKLQAAQTK